jgi:hypothetical protein
MADGFGGGPGLKVVALKPMLWTALIGIGKDIGPELNRAWRVIVPPSICMTEPLMLKLPVVVIVSA